MSTGGLDHLDPDKLARLVEALRAEKEQRARRAADPVASLAPEAWARSFRGRPRAFAGELIGPDFLTADTWTAWRAFLGALFGEELSPAELEIYRACTALDDPPALGVARQQAWMPIGRRGGKSRILAFIACYMALAIDWRPYLAAGETGFVVVLAAQRKQAQAIMGYVKAFLAHPRIAPLVADPLTESVSLTVPVTIEVVTASISAVRSRTVVCALLDEVAFWRTDDGSANPDVDILNAIEPATATIPEAMILGASSPYAKRGLLYEMHKRYFGRRPDELGAIHERLEDESEDGLEFDPDEVPLVWVADTRTMNPTVPQRFINKRYRRDPASAAAEYGARFRDDVDVFISRAALETLVQPGLTVRPPTPFSVRYRAFVDASGGAVDSMTLGIAHRDPVSGNAVLDLTDEVRPPFEPAAVVARFRAHLRAYRITSVTGDRYGGEWVRQAFTREGIAFEHSDLTATQIYTELLPLLTGGRADLLDLDRLLDQLAALERRSSRSTNREVISHPTGGHDDLANAAAGALVLVGARPAFVITREIVDAVRARGAARRLGATAPSLAARASQRVAVGADYVR